MSDTIRFGPDDVSEGDEIRFVYGPPSRLRESRQTVSEVREFNVRVEDGGLVSYRDIKTIHPQGEEQ